MSNKYKIKNKILTSLSTAILLSGLSTGYAITANAQGPEINSKASLTVDYETGQILQGEDIDQPLEIASMTKMIVEYIVFEEIDAGELTWDTEITISDHAYNISQNYALSNVPLRNGESYSLQELYEAMAIYSANGATIAIAEAIEGSEEKFVNRMIETVESFGVEDAFLVNSTGLNNSDLGENVYPGSSIDDENVMSARSIAIVAERLLRDYPEVLEIASIPRKTFREGTDDSIEMDNWNWMLKGLLLEREGVDGLKTGTTDKAGATFTGTAVENDRRLLTVIMHAPSEDLSLRFRETSKMMDYGFDRFESHNVMENWESGIDYQPVTVNNGKKSEVNYEPTESLDMLLESGDDLENISYEIEWNSDIVNENGSIDAPLKKDMELGYLVVNYDNNEFGYLNNKGNKIPIVTTEDVKQTNILGRTWNKIKSFFGDLIARFK